MRITVKTSLSSKFISVPQNCVDGDLRLVGGPSNREGRVEMCYRGVWGAISDLEWNNQAAAVTCRQLGFEPSGMYGYATLSSMYLLAAGELSVLH